jgi:hypothetical protein
VDASAAVAAGAGFLLAVIWFDLMFDVQVLRHRGGELPEDVLGSIAAYYGRVTSAARPMSWLVGAVMAATLAALAAQIASGQGPRWVGPTSLALAAGPILLAGLHTLPLAVRLGARRDPAAVQTRLARSVCRDHLLCLAAIAALLVVQLGFAG